MLKLKCNLEQSLLFLSLNTPQDLLYNTHTGDVLYTSHVPDKKGTRVTVSHPCPLI